MKSNHQRITWCIKSAIIFALILVLSLINIIYAEEIEPVDDETCLDCHEQFDLSLRPSAHRLSSEINNPSIVIVCVNCHEGADAHLEDPDRGTIGNPALVSGAAAQELCFECHITHVDLDNYGFDTHAVDEMNCSACHQIHGYKASLLVDDRANFCRQCHAETLTDFIQTSNHPVNQGNLTCLSCHSFTKRLDDNLGYDLSGVCRDCHPDQAGPFLYEHEAINAYSIEGGGCVECHTPHGSANDHLLRQPGNQLCNQCHLPAGHLTAHGGIWADYSCQVCHTETHGSFVSNLYLDDNLPAKLGGDCYNTGCHGLNR